MRLFFQLLLIPLVSALFDNYELTNDKVLQTCAYVESLPMHSYFYHQQPVIKVSAIPNIDVDMKEFETYVLMMGGPDMADIHIGLNPFYKVCDEIALKEGYCEHETDEVHYKKKTLPELIEENKFKYQIESFLIKFDDNLDKHVYQVSKSGVYCIRMLTGSIPEAVNSVKFEIEWRQSYGDLLISDYYRMFTSFYFSMIYFLTAIVLAFLAYRRVSRDGKTAITLDNLKYKKYTIQYKFILFFTCYGILYLSTSINYQVMNKLGYTSNSIILPLTNLLDLSLTTFITCWVIYNIMLFSAGAWVDSKSMNSSLKVKITKITCLVLILEMLLYDVETSTIYSLIGDHPRDLLSILIYIEYVLIMLTCIIWSTLTIINIQDKKLKNIYLITIILLTFLFSIVIFGAYIFSSTQHNAMIAYSIELVCSLVLAFLWNKVVFENNQLVYLV